MSERPTPFFFIIADRDQGFFCIEGPMTDDQPWPVGAMDSRNDGQRNMCGPADPDRDVLAADYQRACKLAGTPLGSIVRVRRCGCDRATPCHRENGGTLEKAAQMANHASTRTAQLYDRWREELRRRHAGAPSNEPRRVGSLC